MGELEEIDSALIPYIVHTFESVSLYMHDCPVYPILHTVLFKILYRQLIYVYTEKRQGILKQANTFDITE